MSGAHGTFRWSPGLIFDTSVTTVKLVDATDPLRTPNPKPAHVGDTSPFYPEIL